MKRRAETVIIPVVLLFACVVMAADGPRLPQDDPDEGPGALPPGEQVSLWNEVNNALLPAERRANAERELIRARDARMLEMVFRGLAGPVEIIHLPDPTTGRELWIEQVSMLRAIGMHAPATGSPEGDVLVGMPVAAQIACARQRIWSELIRRAEPEELRYHVFVDLLGEAEQLPERGLEKDWVIRTLVGSSRRNWTPAVRDRLASIYQNGNREAWARYWAGHTLLDMHHVTPRPEHEEIREMLVAVPWNERGSEFARRMGERLSARDPRAAILKLDWYEHERRTGARAGRLPGKVAVDRIDRAFGNISGKYRDSRAALTPHEQELRERRNALRRKAPESRDDTGLRALNAEIAAQQQVELERRIERIDAWIAGNRDRLEREAGEYLRTLMGAEQDED